MFKVKKNEIGMDIYNYENIENKYSFIPDVLPDLDEKQKLEEHIEKYIGKINMIYHEIVSSIVHIDIYHVAPTKEKPFHTIITSGMSDLAMNVPEGYDRIAYAELVTLLPESWDISEEGLRKEEYFFPIANLKLLARLPHAYGTFLGWGHTIDNGTPAIPYASNTKLNSVVLLPSITFNKNFNELKINDEKTINFYNTTYLYQEEIDYKLKHGMNDLINLFIENGLTEILDVNRNNFCK